MAPFDLLSVRIYKETEQGVILGGLYDQSQAVGVAERAAKLGWTHALMREKSYAKFQARHRAAHSWFA